MDTRDGQGGPVLDSTGKLMPRRVLRQADYLKVVTSEHASGISAEERSSLQRQRDAGRVLRHLYRPYSGNTWMTVTTVVTRSAIPGRAALYSRAFQENSGCFRMGSHTVPSRRAALIALFAGRSVRVDWQYVFCERMSGCDSRMRSAKREASWLFLLFFMMLPSRPAQAQADITGEWSPQGLQRRNGRRRLYRDSHQSSGAAAGRELAPGSARSAGKFVQAASHRHRITRFRFAAVHFQRDWTVKRGRRLGIACTWLGRSRSK